MCSWPQIHISKNAAGMSQNNYPSFSNLFRCKCLTIYLVSTIIDCFHFVHGFKYGTFYLCWDFIFILFYFILFYFLSVWTHWAISHFSQCSTTGITNAVVSIILSVRGSIWKIPCCWLKRVAHVVAAGFLSGYIRGPLPHVWHHITVNKMYSVSH